MNCSTKKEYDTHVENVHEAFDAYPEFVEYFRNNYFSKPESIAKWSIMKIRGGMLTISSAAVEQSHASNEAVLPTKLMDIVSPENSCLRWYDVLKTGSEET